MALLISTASSADQHSDKGVRGSRQARMFGKQVCSAEPCTTGLCPTCLRVHSGTAHIIPIAAIINVSILITWTVVPDNDAKIQRRIGDRAVGGQFELDDGLVIGGEPAEIARGEGLGHLDIAERASGLRRSGGQGQRRQRNGDQCCQLSGGGELCLIINCLIINTPILTPILLSLSFYHTYHRYSKRKFQSETLPADQ